MKNDRETDAQAAAEVGQALDQAMPLHSSRSKTVAAAAIHMALTASREDEKRLCQNLAAVGIQTAAADFGGPFIQAIPRLVERAVVAAKREGLIGDTHAEEGAVAGAAHEAVSQLIQKALGLNVGGKIGIARAADQVTVCAFFGIGLLHLDEVAIGLGHRVI